MENNLNTTMEFTSSAMEKDLHDRDVVGLQDFLFLEDFQNENSFIDNLKKRFDVDLIYTYIGQVLISVNPYKELQIYSEDHVKDYRRKHFFEKSPHVFAISENAFRSLTEENIGQCILISGESGSGKTEASKKVLQYIAAASGHETTIETVKDKLLQSNPVLEAFGNAKTNRNDNSSRFGKYMDVQFNYTGEPVGGNILNYLLEKSRVIHQNSGERNFHIFYQLLAGADDTLLNEIHLKRDLNAYYYLSDGDKGLCSNIPDKQNFKIVQNALNTIEMSADDQKLIFQILSSILQLGNVKFSEDEDKSKIINIDTVKNISKLLGCDAEKLIAALTHRTIDAQGDVVVSPMNQELSVYARDALGKAIYDRLFSWLVTKINVSLHVKHSDRLNNVIGILDIYGFEIFTKNSFEQFCINFCNEKLQQLFIELTLKSEQEEYLREGVEWEPVPYFDNKVICNLIEEKYKGIVALMDEECLRPGVPTDASFLSKMDTLINHKHYISHSKASLAVQKVMGRDEFRLIHYAGEVTYNVEGFLDKNNDLLFRDLKEVMSKSSNEIVRKCFPEDEYLNKKRPNTAVTQFKTSLNQLMEILMCKEPSYIRCIKPNELQSPNRFDTELVRHQVKYLGLMENLRVRRAGFAYRRKYEMFLQRYKCLSAKTWPNYAGPAKDGVEILIKELNYSPDEYRLGKTKIFIRSPNTLFKTEDEFQKKKHYLISKIKAAWKGHRQRVKYLEMKRNIIIVQCFMRRYFAMRALKKRRDAAITIRAFIKGFITRNDAPNKYNESFIAHAKRQWLIKLSQNLPRGILDKSWPTCPRHCIEASEYLKKLHKLYLVKIYKKNLSKDRKRQLELKVLAEQLFKDKKASYERSIGPWFLTDCTNTVLKPSINEFVKKTFNTEHLQYSTTVVKYDRHGYKPRERLLLLSEKAVYILDAKSFKQKHRLPLDKINFCVTNDRDSLLLMRIPSELKNDKGDLILEPPQLIELCVWIVDVTKNKNLISILATGSPINHNLVRGKSGTIEILPGPQPQIKRAKSGNLIVVPGQ